MTVSRISTNSAQSGFPKYTSIWDGTTAVGSMEAISSVTLTASQTNIEFNSIPQTYTHLQIRITGRTDSATYANSDIYMRFGNSVIDLTSNYDSHRLYGDGSTASTDFVGNTSQTYMDIACLAGAGAASNTFGIAVIDILDYTNTNKTKVVKCLSGEDNANGTYKGVVLLNSGLWRSTSAITNISLFPQSSANFLQYTSISLYGVK